MLALNTLKSIRALTSMQVKDFVASGLRLSQLWNTPSQSDLKKGDYYGCVDGEDVFIEMADSTRYRFSWYRCPLLHEANDSAFYVVDKLINSLSTSVFNQTSH